MNSMAIPTLTDRLADNREALDSLIHERRRLAVGLLTLGLSEREVASIAGVSGPVVHQWNERGEAR